MRFRFLVFAILLSLPLAAQAPHADWRTVETESFRIHYPQPWEEWAHYAAERIEDAQRRVEREVGWEIVEKVDVLVMDPYATANGSAWPLLGWPRMVLWTNPPSPESVIGANRDWIELLTVHEIAHLAHLLRPSRNPLRRALQPLLPISPIAFAPRWATEGYATVIEGELTGTGRPNSDIRAAILRRWAQQGRLPSYGALNSDHTTWMGMSMAYLVGSAYLEWLRDREGEHSLRNLWARLTAREKRSFDVAFAGVFGDSPQALYRRFTAELTARAVEVEIAIEPHLREGELWQDLAWTTEAPDVSEDGTHLVSVLRKRGSPSTIAVFETAPDEEALQKYVERIEKMLERDPDDVAPVQRGPLPRKPEYQRVALDGAEPSDVRFLPGGEAVLFVRFEPDADGMLHPDLFLWDLPSDSVRRVTRYGDVRDADPAPDGARAVAVRNRYGHSQLVTVDLTSGRIDPLTPPSVETTFSSPRWSPGGESIAWVEHSNGRWRLMLRHLGEGATRELSVPDGSLIAQPAWQDEDTLYALVGQGGFLEIHRFDLPAGTSSQLTRSLGAALAPAPAADGSALYFLSIDADGLDIRKLDDPSRIAALEPVSIDPGLAPAIRPPTPTPPLPLQVEPVPESRAYGFGRRESRVQTGGGFFPSSRNLEVGLSAGDVVGRFSSLLLAELGATGDETGYALASAWRGWPVEIRGHLFSAEHEVSRQPGCESSILACSDSFYDFERSGGELALAWSRFAGRTMRISAEAGALLEQIDDRDGSFDRRVLFAAIEPQLRRSIGRIRLGLDAQARFESLGGDSGASSRTLGGAGVLAGYADTYLSVGVVSGSVDDHAPLWEQFVLGGASGSILPHSALSTRIVSPALPIGVGFGTEYRGEKASFSFGGPLRAFYERHRLWNGGGSSRGEWIEVAGLETTIEISPQPLLRLPGMALRAGVAQVLTAPLEDDVQWWIGTTLRP
ncbi:MAG: TolB family protein [Thermoanaerobaculia bacterium]